MRLLVGSRLSIVVGMAGIAALGALGCARGQARGSAEAAADAWGRPVALLPQPRRVVSLAPATTELVFALGLGARLVGRTTWCDWPPAAHRVADVGPGISPNVEAVVALRPDLVLVYPSEANRSAVTQLEGLGTRVAVVRQDAVADWRETARLVALLAGRPAAAESLLDDFERRLAAARAAPAPDSLSVFIAVAANPPMAIGRGSFVSELVTLAGARNVFEDVAAPSAVVGLEAVVARDPDVVLVLGPESAARGVARRPGWQSIRAVREGRVVAVDGGQFNRPSPRLPEAVGELSAVLARAGAARAVPAR